VRGGSAKVKGGGRGRRRRGRTQNPLGWIVEEGVHSQVKVIFSSEEGGKCSAFERDGE